MPSFNVVEETKQKLSLSVKSMIKGKKIFLISQFKEIIKIKVSFTFRHFSFKELSLFKSVEF